MTRYKSRYIGIALVIVIAGFIAVYCMGKSVKKGNTVSAGTQSAQQIADVNYNSSTVVAGGEDASVYANDYSQAVTGNIDNTTDSFEVTVDEKNVKPYIVDTEVKRVVNSTEIIKYGATRKNITEYTYEVYNDDSRKEIFGKNKIVVDRSTYNATDDMLCEEAEHNADVYETLWNELLFYINEFRKDNGVEPVILDVNMCRAACMRAVEIDYAAYFNHMRPDGRTAFTALDYYDCYADFRGENLAGGQRTAELVVKAWEESDKGHRELLLNSKVRRMGCGYSYSGTIGYPVWTLELAD